VHPSLGGYATAVLEDAVADGSVARVAEDLGAVESLVTHNPSLAAALTDVVVPAPARQAVVEELVAGRIAPAALRLVVRTVHDERAPDLPVALHELAELAHLTASFRAEDVEAEQPRLGRIGARRRAAGYAAAVFESLPAVHDIEEVEDELFRFARIVESNPQLRDTLADPAITVAARRRLVGSLLEGKVHPATLRLARAVIHQRVRDVVQGLDFMVEQAAVARGWRLARVRAARPVDADVRAQLADQLRRLTGRPVELQVTVDPGLLGGVVVEVGDLRVDATAVHRLEQLQEHLLGPEGATRGAIH